MCALSFFFALQGNWSTDLSGGSQFGYTLLFTILLSNLIAILLQHLSLKLGVASGRDLAQACRDAFSTPVCIFLWIICEVSIMATDLAEVIGSAIAINLLVGLNVTAGCCITAVDVLIILLLGSKAKSFRLLEFFVATLTLLITGVFIFELTLAKPGQCTLHFALSLSTAMMSCHTSLVSTLIVCLCVAVRLSCFCLSVG